MSIIQKLKNLNLDPETMVSLSYSEGTDVFVHNETEVETAMAETDVVSTVAELLATPGLKLYSSWGDSEILDELRSAELLEDYARGEGDFAEYLTETINDNFYDVEVVEYSTEKYDHKRGFCTLSVSLRAKVSDLVSASPWIDSWNVSVPTENGTLTLS